MHEPASEHVERAPHPRLRPFISSYTGYRVVGMNAGIHAGLPSSSLTCIVAFDEQLDVESASGRGRYWAMLAGLHAAPALVHHQGRQHGVQLAITPRGASALFGLPASELAHRVEHLDQIVPAAATELIDRLSSARTWRARWSVVDDVFLRVLRLDREIPPELERAWAELCRRHGTVSVEQLAQTAGWSRRHFTKQFSESYGLTPKVMSRVMRFERAQQMLRLPTRPSLASVAAVCGYADQAHMSREWTEFAGSPPTTWMQDEILPVSESRNGSPNKGNTQ